MSESGVPNGFHQIPGFPRYAIDENGIVISICPRNGQKKAKTWSDARRVKPWTDKLGYHRVQLFHDGNQRTVKVHRLVLLTFVGPCPAGMQCRHLDGNPGNNHVSNLTWGSSSENHRDKILHGTSGLGDKNGNEPTHWQLVDAALSCHHDYGLLPPEKQSALRFEAKQWLHAWRKVFMQPSYVQKQEQPTPAPLQLREGAWYRSVDGELFGPAKRDSWSNTDEFCWLMGTKGFWNAFGKEVSERHKDLIAEVPPPVEPEQFKPGDWVVPRDYDTPNFSKWFKRGVAERIRTIEGDWLSCFDGDACGWSVYYFRRATPAEIAAYKQAQEPQPDADGWIEWKGGECPVSDETLVDVRFREPLKGEPDSIVSLSNEAGEWEWHHNHAGGDIVAYRLVPSPQPAPVNECSLRYWWVQWVTPPTLDDLMATDKRGKP